MLDANLVAIFRAALISLKNPESAGQTEEIANRDLDEPFAGAVAIDDSYLDGLREALRKAARFDGLTDPFPPKPDPPAGSR